MKRIGDLIGKQYRKWEQSGEIYVFATDHVELSCVETTMATISDVIDEFNLPLRILNGKANKSEDIPLVENLIACHTEDNLIDCDGILKKIKRYWNEGTLRYGLVVLVNSKRYEFRNEPSDPEPAEYGWSDYEGLSVLRRFDIQNAVRHEFGHMVGLGLHHQDCAMDWKCTIQDFCGDCRRTINEIWSLS